MLRELEIWLPLLLLRLDLDFFIRLGLGDFRRKEILLAEGIVHIHLLLGSEVDPRLGPLSSTPLPRRLLESPEPDSDLLAPVLLDQLPEFLLGCRGRGLHSLQIVRTRWQKWPLLHNVDFKPLLLAGIGVLRRVGQGRVSRFYISPRVRPHLMARSRRAEILLE